MWHVTSKKLHNHIYWRLHLKAKELHCSPVSQWQCFVYKSNSGFQSTIICQMFCNKCKRALTIKGNFNDYGGIIKNKMNTHTHHVLPPAAKTKITRSLIPSINCYCLSLVICTVYFKSSLCCCFFLQNRKHKRSLELTLRLKLACSLQNAHFKCSSWIQCNMAMVTSSISAEQKSCLPLWAEMRKILNYPALSS